MLARSALRLAVRVAPDPEPEPEPQVPEGWHDAADVLPMLGADTVWACVGDRRVWRYAGGESHWQA
jgi:hypothetical protein